MANPKNPASDNAVNDTAPAATESGLPSISELAGMLDDHKGKLAIGVAATLGLMVFYSWREKRLAKEDPEAHAIHQRSKAIVRAAEIKTGRLREEPPKLQADEQPAVRPQRGEEDTLLR